MAFWALLAGGAVAVALPSALPQEPLTAVQPPRRTRQPLAPLRLRGGAGLSLGVLSGPAAAYAAALGARPVATKALTSGVIFGLSDICAQTISPGPEGSRDWKRTTVAALVGLLYFGPAAHFWYEMVTALFPQSGFKYTMMKTALGQSIFGPVFTCIFFAATLLATAGVRGLAAFPGKVRRDLLPTQLAGTGFWPFVDMVSYSCIPVMWIPLFINTCSFVWTIFLSLQAARAPPPTKSGRAASA